MHGIFRALFHSKTSHATNHCLIFYVFIKDGVVLKTEKLGKDEIEYDTYPPPDIDFKYEDPYVTEEEMRQIALERVIRIKCEKCSDCYLVSILLKTVNF